MVQLLQLMYQHIIIIQSSQFTLGFTLGVTHYMYVLSHISHIQLFATLYTVACQTPLSKGFSRQEYWNGLPCLPPGNLPDPGIECRLLFKSLALAGGFFSTRATWETLDIVWVWTNVKWHVSTVIVSYRTISLL